MSDQPTQTRDANRVSLILLFATGLLSFVWGPLAEHSAPFLRPLKYLWLIVFIITLVLRPEFRRAVWGREDERELPASFSGKSEGWREWGFVFALYIVLAVVFTLPDSIHPTRALLGRGGDNYLHAWFLWEFARAVAHGQNPFYTTLILYPTGANLAWATTDILGQIMAIPFSLLLGPVLAYNLSLMLQLALGALCARLLCKRVCGDGAASTIGGMIFGFSPFLLAHAWGHLSLITTFPLPLYVLALGRLLDKEKPSWKDGVLLGLGLALVALANYEYALIFCFFTVLILAIDFGRAGWAMVKRLSVPLVISAAVFFVCLTPVVLMMLKDYRVTKPVSLGHAVSFSADVLSFFVPSLQQSLLGRFVRNLPAQFFVGPGGIEGVEFIGVAAGILAVIGSWVARGKQRRWAGRAMIAGVVFALLSLGPVVHVLGTPSSLLAPAAPFYKLGVMRFLREPGRFSVVTMLCVAVLASIGLSFLVRRVQVQWKQAVSVAVIGLFVVVEYLAYPFPSSSVVQPARYFVPPKTTQACTVPPSVRDGSVLTIPLDDWWHHNDAMWMQMQDGGRYSLIDGRISPYVPGEVWNGFIDETPILRVLHAETWTDRPPERAQAATKSVLFSSDGEFANDVVKQLNLRAVVVFDAAERPGDVDYVRKVFGAHEIMAGTCAVFELPAYGTRLANRAPLEPAGRQPNEPQAPIPSIR